MYNNYNYYRKNDNYPQNAKCHLQNLDEINFVAIDFETANTKRESATSLALIKVENGKAIGKLNILINPEDEFEEFNIKLTGITPEMVKGKPTFPEVLEKIRELLSTNLVIAHNASFDISVIRKSCEKYNIELPTLTYFCTVELSKLFEHDSLNNHDLASVCEYLDIPLLNHHNAMEDTLACANVLLKLFRKNSINSFNELADKYNVHYKTINNVNRYDYKKSIPTNYKKPKKKSIDLKDIQRNVELSSIDQHNHFYGKVVSFTGELVTMSREDAIQKIFNLGGHGTKNFNSDIDCLVVGIQNTKRLASQNISSKKSSKMIKAEKMIEKGCQIEIISEKEFLEFIKL